MDSKKLGGLHKQGTCINHHWSWQICWWIWRNFTVQQQKWAITVCVNNRWRDEVGAVVIRRIQDVCKTFLKSLTIRSSELNGVIVVGGCCWASIVQEGDKCTAVELGVKKRPIFKSVWNVWIQVYYAWNGENWTENVWIVAIQAPVGSKWKWGCKIGSVARNYVSSVG